MSSESKLHYIKYVKYPIVWIISFIGFLILVDVVKIAYTQELILFGMFASLLVVWSFHAQRKGKTHFGHVPVIVGFYLLLIAGGLLVGDLKLDLLEKYQWWQIADTTHKIYLGVITFIGLILMKIGLKTTLQNWWWWRPLGGNRR